jgi:hypothetical protein
VGLTPLTGIGDLLDSRRNRFSFFLLTDLSANLRGIIMNEADQDKIAKESKQSLGEAEA